MASDTFSGDAVNTAPPSRPKLNLKPRDEAHAAQLEYQRQQSIKKNPFGEAKPREAIIAARVGKTEEEILKEEVKKEKLHLRLNPQQIEEKRAHEAAVKEVEDEIGMEDDASKKEVLAAELASRQQKLDALMESFEKMALETALSGGAPRVSEMRRQQSGPDAMLAPPGGMAAPPGRYQPTQQYAGAARGGGRAGGFPEYGQAPRTGYQPTRNYGGRGGAEGGYGAPQGAYDGGLEGGYKPGGGGYQQPRHGGARGGFGGGSGYQPARGEGDDGFGEGFDRQGSRYARTGDSSDQGFFDAPSLSGGSGGGRGRGRGGRGGYGRDYGTPGGFGEPSYGFGGSQGIGGEIHFESQDRF